MPSEQRVLSKQEQLPGEQPGNSLVMGLPHFRCLQGQDPRAVLTSPQKTEGSVSAFEELQCPSPLFSAFTFVCTFLQIVLDGNSHTMGSGVGQGRGTRMGSLKSRPEDMITLTTQTHQHIQMTMGLGATPRGKEKLGA